MRLIFVCIALLFTAVPAFGGMWEVRCSSCHNGRVAPKKESLLKKFKTPEDFMDAVRKAVLSGKMPRHLGYGIVAKELYGRFPSCPRRCRCLNDSK